MSDPTLPISVTVLTKNNELTIERLLISLEGFDEVLVADTGSGDDTLDIAKRFKNVKIVKVAFEGFGPTHNAASTLAKNDWVLSLDSDEEMLKPLFDEISRLSLDTNSVYSIPRYNYYRGQWIYSCGWYPDRVLRLYNKGKTSFSLDQVHERILSQGLQVVNLKEGINHYPYRTTDDFLRKMQFYTTLFAKQKKGKKTSTPCSAFFHGLWAFIRAYIIKGGIFQGSIGFELSFYNGATAYYKYLKLARGEDI